ncbi:CRISPR-associated protein [Anabaena minutissima FACHB-250]|nr:CRISPR-associated protein [Anabaena minutissima FACHB-250]
MPRLIISTVGTSLLTNQISPRRDPKDWSSRLQEMANKTQNEICKYHQDVDDIIQKLRERAEETLSNGTTLEIRDASAELNGIYGIYEEDLEKGKEDIHWLIATDTAQGQTTSEMVREFLVKREIINTQIYPELGSEFSTATTSNFSQGMAQIIPWIKELIKGYQESYPKNKLQVIFNLVGGFKAIQGYMNTIGMFYAHEIVYIFEGSNKLIKIPRLPVEIKLTEVEPYKVQLAMMDVAEILTSWEEAEKVPEDWRILVKPEMTLSTWGKLVWQQCKDVFLAQDKPLIFPKIEYKSTFLDDYCNKPAHEKIILQENLARVACLLNNHQDGISAMKQDGIFRLRRYVGKHKDIDHFDLPKDRRVSCLAKNGQLHLLHYGEHNYVNDKYS